MAALPLLGCSFLIQRRVNSSKITGKATCCTTRAILEDYQEIGAEVWKRLKRGRKEQLWYFDELLKIYEARRKDWRIVKEVKSVVSKLRRVSASESL